MNKTLLLLTLLTFVSCSSMGTKNELKNDYARFDLTTEKEIACYNKEIAGARDVEAKAKEETVIKMYKSDAYKEYFDSIKPSLATICKCYAKTNNYTKCQDQTLETMEAKREIIYRAVEFGKKYMVGMIKEGIAKKGYDIDSDSIKDYLELCGSCFKESLAPLIAPITTDIYLKDHDSTVISHEIGRLIGYSYNDEKSSQTFDRCLQREMGTWRGKSI